MKTIDIYDNKLEKDLNKSSKYNKYNYWREKSYLKNNDDILNKNQYDNSYNETPESFF